MTKKKNSTCHFFLRLYAGICPNKQVLFTIKNQSDVKCYRIQSIITSAKGILIAAIDERVPNCGDLLYNPNINIVIRKSDDKGKT
ncbi:glycoside hydrolase [Empedobacter falsenii]